MAMCKFCGAAISWRQQGFKWIAETNGRQHNCVPTSPAVMDERRRIALDHQAARLLAQKGAATVEKKGTVVRGEHWRFCDEPEPPWVDTGWKYSKQHGWMSPSRCRT